MAFGKQVGKEDQQGEDKDLIVFIDILQLLDLGGQNHGPAPARKIRALMVTMALMK